MADVAAAPAPAASSTPAPAVSSNGASKGTQTPAAGVSSGTSVNPAPKGTATASPTPGEATKTRPPPGFEVTPEGKFRIKGLKVDGVEQDAEYTEEELRREFQTQRAGQKRLQEAAEEKKKLASALGMMKQDPIGAMRALGMDPEQAFAAHLSKQAQLAAMSDEQRQVLKAREQAQQYQRQVQQYQAQLTEHATQQQWETQWKPELTAAFQEVGWTGDSEANLLAVAELAEVYEKAGIEMKPRELVQLIDAESSKTALNWVTRASPQKALEVVSAAIPRLSPQMAESLLDLPQVRAAMEARKASIIAKRNPASGQFVGSPPAPIETARKEFTTPEEAAARIRAKR